MITLPVPPSTNNLFFNARGGKGRRKSDAYKAWIEEAGWQLNAQRPVPVRGPVNVAIFVPLKMRGDIDNRIKAILDLLVAHRVIDDDRHLQHVSISRGDAVKAGNCVVDVSASVRKAAA